LTRNGRAGSIRSTSMAQLGSAPPPAPAPRERLESWKEIAAYLKRSIRAVQEWEKKEGLPVHRHQHEKLGTVYAFKPEIDAWWAGRRTQLEQPGKTIAVTRRRWLWVAAAAIVIVAGFAAVAWWTRGPALPFEERDWVLIAQFDNRTGEPVFDGTLEYALERELSNSRFVNVVPRERVNDTLLLMKKPTNTIITASIAREVALRDGGIRALLTGRVEKLDSTYLLSVVLVNPSNGATVRSFSEEASGQREVAAVLRHLSSQVRLALGEGLAEIQKSAQALERVSTPSLRALQLFSQADQVLSQPVPGGWPEDVGRRRRAQLKQAEELFQQAVGEDTEFASAHMHLAWTILNQGRPAEEYRPYAERAMRLSGKVSEAERLYILGSYYQQKKELDEAVAQYETLVRLYPDHFWGNSNLADAYERLGRPDEAVPHVKRRAHLRPNDFGQNCRAAMAVGRLTGKPEEAEPYVARARQLSSEESTRRYAQCAAYLETFPIYEHMFAGRVERVLAEADRIAATLPMRTGETRHMFIGITAELYIDIGRLKQAEALIRQFPDPVMVHWNLALVARERGDSREFKQRIVELSRQPNAAFWFDMPIVYARVGLLDESDKWIQAHPDAVGIDTARGELALARGQRTEGLRLLQKGFASLRRNRSVRFFNAAEGLARALELQGDLEGAVRILEEASQQRGLAVMFGPIPMWNQLRHDQARLYRRLGREPEAERIEDELRKLLAYADDDHAIARELRAAGKLRAEGGPR